MSVMKPSHFFPSTKLVTNCKAILAYNKHQSSLMHIFLSLEEQ